MFNFSPYTGWKIVLSLPFPWYCLTYMCGNSAHVRRQTSKIITTTAVQVVQLGRNSLDNNGFIVYEWHFRHSRHIDGLNPRTDFLSISLPHVVYLSNIILYHHQMPKCLSSEQKVIYSGNFFFFLPYWWRF